MNQRPTILITNDDGVHAAGIRHLWKALSAVADVVVVAPASEQSAVGLSITIRRPLQIEEVNWYGTEAKVWSVNGTPADSVKLALSVVLPEPPQLIISGINRGTNAGRNVLYSGTVAAVVEGMMHHIPGMAISIGEYTNPSYEELEAYIPSLVNYMIEHPLPQGTFLNVNFPENMKSGIKGIHFTKQGREYWVENPEKRQHPAEDVPYYWLGAQLAKYDEEDDCDITWLKEGYATVVPIQMSDLTHHEHLQQQKNHFKQFIEKSHSFQI